MSGAEQTSKPTEAMLVAARDWSYEKYGKPIGNDGACGCWSAMFAASAFPALSAAAREFIAPYADMSDREMAFMAQGKSAHDWDMPKIARAVLAFRAALGEGK